MIYTLSMSFETIKETSFSWNDLSDEDITTKYTI